MYDVVFRGASVVNGLGTPLRVTDVAINGGVIAAIGAELGAAKENIDAHGLVLAPGWVDVHTHYDGQVSWDDELSPSSWHGVTTVVMGNCGVGFAPVRPDGHQFLIELMEGVEDIPETALHEGITWAWESFPDYLNFIASRHLAIDVLSQVPHAALRAYVMGDRAHDDATHEEVERMAALVEEALRAGAVGFTTSRTVLHRSKHGLVPGTAAPEDELLTIADAMGRVGHGVFQLISDHQGSGPEIEFLCEIARRTGGTVTYTVAQSPLNPTAYRDALASASAAKAQGFDLRPQVAVRPTGMLFGLQSSLHPFITHPTMKKLNELSLAERVAELRRPEVREQLLSEEATTDNFITRILMSRWEEFFPLGDDVNYEPAASESVAARAEREGRRPEEVTLDLLLEDEGRAFLFAPLASYVDKDHEALREMMEHPSSVLGLSDGGAHCGLICDVSFPTYLLTHWVLGRTRGPRLTLEQAVAMQTFDTAHSYGLTDRGSIEVGKRADLNLIDLATLTLHSPEMVFDLPGGGRRIVQRATGYVATMKDGIVTYRAGVGTGELPGSLVRAGNAVDA
jgi:N-acyl-D-aspartate/D-glutamate deacylase